MLKAYGMTVLEFKDFAEAVKLFKILKKLCEAHKKYFEKMYVYK